MSYHSETPELITDLIDNTKSMLVKKVGLPEVQADLISVELANMIINHWAGTFQYIPKGTAMRISSRDQEIYAKFSGNNHAELASEYKLSIQWIYRIVKRAGAADMAEKQPDLFSSVNDSESTTAKSGGIK